MSTKKEAFNFLRSVEDYLNKTIPPPSIVAEELSSIVKKAKSSGKELHKAYPEGAFLNHYIAPAFFEFLKSQVGLNAKEAKKAFLSESYRNISEFASASPARSQRHPFKKVIGVRPREIIKQWKGEGQGSSVAQSCPDMAFRSPCPHTIIFEGKYFSKGNIQSAETALATDIYQAFFYLGLSHLPETSKHPAWNYDYVCMLAYDATKSGSLKEAWESLDKKVKIGCWEGASIYVMILRGNS